MRIYLLWSLLLLMLTACHPGADLKYLDSRTTQNLEIPPDLTEVVLNDTFEIPSVFSSGVDETLNNIPVLAQVESIRLEGSADFYWLAIDDRVKNLYQTIKNFWASEGYTLDIDEPVIGIMQTRWVFKKEGASNEDKKRGFLEALFAGKELSASQDQFRTRLARDSDTDTVRIYISHRGTQYQRQFDIRQKDYEIPDDWSFRAPDPELEIEMLSRLMVYLGLAQAAVDSQMAKARLFQPRVTIHTDNAENETFLLARAVKQQTWNRLLHQLNRLDIEVISSDPNRGFSGNGVIVVKTAHETEIATSGLAAIFSTSIIELVPKEVVLIVSEESHDLTRISIQTPDGNADTSASGLEFLTMLYEHMR